MRKMTPRGIPLKHISGRAAGRAPGRPGLEPAGPAQRPVQPGQRPARAFFFCPVLSSLPLFAPILCVNVYECSDDDMYI
jgi:hypothetical protein